MSNEMPFATETPVSWDVDLFLRFETERSRPARDLLIRIEGAPQRAFDLGCGPGTSTRLIVERFPAAEVIGLDSSTEMIEEARRRVPGVEFRRMDMSLWRPQKRVDLIFSDNTLQWVADHRSLFPRLMNFLSPGGTLAVEMPDNHQEPSHVLMRLIAADGPWADRLVPVAKTRAVISAFYEYYDWLRPLARDVELWRTTYIHPLSGVDALIDWFRGSVLLPYLAPLSPAESEAFLDRYRSGLEEAYPAEPDGRLLFLIPRLFILARKPG